MQHYFAIEKLNHQLIFSPSDIHHMTHVMRFSVGEKVIGIWEGLHYEVELQKFENKIIGKILSQKNNQTELATSITLIIGLPRQEKWELILQKATELGVTRIIPWLSERSLIRLEEEQIQTKMKRWNTILKEAAEQSERQQIPLLETPSKKIPFKQLPEQRRLFAFERAPLEPSLHRILKGHPPTSTVVVIGPEGGLSEKEVDLLTENHFQMISLGPRILRSETAVLYVLSILSFFAEEAPHD